MNGIILYLGIGVVFWILLHTFFEWEEGLGLARKVCLSIWTIVLWPVNILMILLLTLLGMK